jgi:hypothetical protein
LNHIRQLEPCCRKPSVAFNGKPFSKETYEKSGTVDKIGVINGAYHAKSGVVVLVAATFHNPSEARETLRHEILGHYGLNTFQPVDKQALLEKTIASKNELKETPRIRSKSPPHPKKGRSRTPNHEELSTILCLICGNPKRKNPRVDSTRRITRPISTVRF